MNNIEKNKNYYIKEIKATDARGIVKRYHYSKKVVSNSSLHLGIFSFSDILVGCLQLGPPMNGEKTSKKLSTFNNMLELNRMVMTDEEPRNAESQALALGFKWLKHNTNLDYILSFSDGKQGNVGYIYQATNWIYIGYRVSSSFYDLDGDIVHNVTVWHRYKEKHKDRHIKTTDQILYDNFNNVSKIYCKQFIYVYPLHKKCTFMHYGQPYPKKETEIPIIKRIIHKRNGVQLSPKKIDIYSNEKLSPVI